MNSAETKRKVREYCKAWGLKIHPKPDNEPLISKGDWLSVFDSWDDALAFFRRAWEEHHDHSKPYPWESQRKENPMPSKKPSAAQLAARARFAAAARAGTLKKGKSLRAKNPLKTTKNPPRAINPLRVVKTATAARPAHRYTVMIGRAKQAHTSDLKTAKDIAQWCADLYGKPVQIVDHYK